MHSLRAPRELVDGIHKELSVDGSELREGTPNNPTFHRDQDHHWQKPV